MAAAAHVLISRMSCIREICLDDEMYDDAASLDTLIEAVNAAGHNVYTWEGCVDSVRRLLDSHIVPLDETIREMVEECLTK